ncbi:MAG: YhgE/Pip domain-containing protein [Bifidobacteriaceae bacterium]|nr:YhgE/Pip domain-containing protein [Bifidobacteriaceae bacterium]
MRNMWKLFVGDLRRATMNVSAVIVIIGLVMLPALFTWFNVAASWDPFSNTKNLKFAIANSDEGYKSDLVPIKINIGDSVVNALRANDQLNWVFTDEDNAIDGTKSGEYYAAVIIPKDFSTDMMTFFSDNMTHAKLEYYTNEKLNALAPEITGQGASGVSSNINTTFTETLADVSLELVNSFASYLDSDDTRTIVVNVNNHLGDLEKQTRTASTTVGAYSTLVDSASTILDSSNALIDLTKQDSATAKSDIDSAVSSVNDIESTLDAASTSLSSAISQSVSAFSSVKTDLQTILDNSANDSAQASQELRDYATGVRNHKKDFTDLATSLAAARDQLQSAAQASGQDFDPQPFNDAIDAINNNVIPALEALATAIDSAADTANSVSGDLKGQKGGIVDKVQTAIDSIQSLSDSYLTKIDNDVTILKASANSISNSLTSINTTLQSTIDQLSQSDGSINDKLSDLKTTIDDASSKLSDTADQIGKIHDALTDAINSSDLSKLQSIINGNAEGLAQSIASPVALERTAVFPVQNFGNAMTPFYSTLAMWVGSLLMCVALRCEPDEETLKGFKKLKPRQKYLGHFGVFAVISLLQSTFLSVGDILFLGLTCQHPLLFILAAQLSGLVFAFFIYSHVFSFGNVGKAVGVLFLVMQVAGAGGAYPLQMLTPLLYDISWFLPARYTINAMRAALCGIYQNDYWWDLLGLIPFMLFALLLGLLLRKPVVKLNENFVRMTKTTKLI